MARNRSNLPRARRKGGYIQKYEEWLGSPAYRDLSCVAKCLLDELQRIYRPDRNGRLSLPVMRAAKLLNVNKDTVTGAFRELAANGFIVLMRGDLWQARLAREWRLTFELCDGREPTDDWKLWKGEDLATLPSRKGRECRQAEVYGVRPRRTFEEAAAKFVRENQHKQTLVDDIGRLRQMMSWIGGCRLDRLSMEAL